MAATRSIKGMKCRCVGIVTRQLIYQLNNLYSMVDRGKIFLSFRKRQTVAGWSILPSPADTRGSFGEVKPPGCKADQSPSSSAEAKNEWSYKDYYSICCHTCAGATLLFRTAESYFNMLSVGNVMPCNTGDTNVIKI
jgi:hypothetical protein